MNKLKKLIPSIALSFVVATGGIAVTGAPLFLTSCASILPGNDAVLVNAERTTALAFDAFDSFFALERGQEAYIKANLPEVHKFANSLRVNAPKYLATARVTTEAYRTNRSATNKANLQTATAILQTALSQVQVYTAQVTAHSVAQP
jgi:hypothetical protein